MTWTGDRETTRPPHEDGPRRLRGVLAAVGLAALPLLFGLAASHTVDDTVHDAARHPVVQAPASAELTELQTPPGLGLGVELGSRLTE